MIFRSTFFRDVLSLSGGTAFTQILLFLLMPFVANIFSPEDFATYSIFIVITSFFSVIGTSTFDQAIIVPKEKRTSQILSILSIISMLSCCLILVLVGFFAFILPEEITNFIFKENILKLYFLGIGSIILCSLGQVLSYLLQREGKFLEISQFRFLQSLLIVLFQIILGYFYKSNYLGLVYGYFLGVGLGGVFLIYRGRESVYELVNLRPKSLEIRSIFNDYIDFFRFQTLSSSITIVSGGLPLLMITHYLGAGIGGSYALAMKLLNAPIILIANSLGEVFRQRVSFRLLEGRADEIFIKLAKFLVLLGVPMFTFAYFVIPTVFSFFFNDQWSPSAEISRIFIPMFFMTFVVSPLSSVIVIARRQKIDLALRLLQIISVVLSFSVAYYLFKTERSVFVAISGAMCLKYLVEFLVSRNLVLNFKVKN